MKIYIVGGAIRDELLNIPYHEKDWLVVGATPDEMVKNKFKQVGKNFPVYIHPKSGEEYALARTEKKEGKGHKGFSFDTSPNISVEEDLKRRDFTINSIAKDPSSGKLIDPCGGQNDLNNKIIRHNTDAFTEDPLRLIRLARFYAKLKPLGFSIAPETVTKINEIVEMGETSTLSAERVWAEFQKAFKCKSPHSFLEVLISSGYMQSLSLKNTTGTTEQKVVLGKLVEAECLNALKFAEDNTTDISERLGAWGALAEQSDISQLINWLPFPNKYKDMMLLANKYLDDYYHSCNKSIGGILSLLYATSAFKQGDIFNRFLNCCDLASRSRIEYRGIPHPQKNFMLTMLHQAKSINAASIMKINLDGEQLAVEIDKQRCAAMCKVRRPYRWSIF